MLNFNFWYLAVVMMVAGAVLVGYSRTHQLQSNHCLVQPKLSRYGTWVRKAYAISMSVLLLVMLVLESLSGAMQLFLDYVIGEKDGEAWAFIFSLCAFACFAGIFGSALNCIAKACENAGRLLTVSGEIILRERGHLKLRNGMVAIPRGERQYWLKPGQISRRMVKDLIVLDTASQDGLARDQLLYHMKRKFSPLECEIMKTVQECLEENARKEELEAWAKETVDAIVEKNITRPRAERAKVVSLPATKPVKEADKQPSTPAEIRQLKPRSIKRPVQEEPEALSPTAEQLEILADCLKEAPRFAKQIAGYQILLRNCETEKQTKKAFNGFMAMLSENPKFFETADVRTGRRLRFYLDGKNSSVKVKYDLKATDEVVANA